MMDEVFKMWNLLLERQMKWEKLKIVLLLVLKIVPQHAEKILFLAVYPYFHCAASGSGDNPCCRIELQVAASAVNGGHYFSGL
jgi:hypothetical protein